MFSMLFFILRIDKDIIDENYYELVQFWHEYRIHQYIKCAGAFVNPKDMTRYLNKP
jgi:hypothetical protein